MSGYDKLNVNSGNETVERQKRELLPLIDQERRTYIRTDYGRMKKIMATEYIDKETGEDVLFHGYNDYGIVDSEKPLDPYELTVEDIYGATKLRKRVERLGTITYLNVLDMFPEDYNRMELLARIYHGLCWNKACSKKDEEALKSGHQPYIDYKNSGFKVIM